MQSASICAELSWNSGYTSALRRLFLFESMTRRRIIRKLPEMSAVLEALPAEKPMCSFFMRTEESTALISERAAGEGFFIISF